MDEKLKVGDILIDDTPMDFSNAPEMTDKEYEEFRENVRKQIAENKE